MPSLSRQLAWLGDLFGGNQNGYGLPLSNRNYFVDGNFDSIIATSSAIAAAATSNGVAAMYYGASGTGGAATLSTTAAPFAVGAEPVGMTSPVSNVLTLSQTTASTGSVSALPFTSPGIFQRIENVGVLQGRSATVSMWLWCASGTQTITNVQLAQNFGSGGSPSATVYTNVAVNWVLTTTPQRFSVLVNVPTTLGKTLGTTASTSYLQVAVTMPTGATYAINTTQWQLEQSSPNCGAAGNPTAFEYRGTGPELVRVQRYYQVSDNPTTTLIGNCTFTGNVNSGSTYYGAVKFPVAMRATPTVTLSQNSASAFTLSVASYTSGPNASGFLLQNNATSTTDGAFFYGWSADARL